MQKITFEREPKLAESAHQCGPPPTAGEVQATGQISAATKPRLNRLLAWRRRNGARELWDWARCKRVTLPTAEHLAEVLMTLDTRTSRVLDTEKATEPPIFRLLLVGDQAQLCFNVSWLLTRAYLSGANRSAKWPWYPELSRC